MSSSDLLTGFSPASDLFAVASGDGRIKIWDTTKGHLQTEFAELAPPESGFGFIPEAKRGHLSVDYKCMKWIQLQFKKKKKAGSSLLVLGTGSGTVLALDVSAGQLKWKVSDCHLGGVSAISYSSRLSCIYTAGADGMVCQIDSANGSLLGKFRASTKGISALSVSADGRILATASAQLKTFDCSSHKKIQKFSGHSVAVRCLIFSEDGKYIVSSGVGERYVAIWKTDGERKQHASCVLSMENPAAFLDCKISDSEDSVPGGLYVLAISELGICYLWHRSEIESLVNSKPMKISLSTESSLSKNNKGLAIYAAKFQGIARIASSQVLVAYGSLIKPSFEKILVQNGTDVNLSTSQNGVLLPGGQFYTSQKGQTLENKVTALDQANAEDAVHPLPKLYHHEKKRKHTMRQTVQAIDNTTVDANVDSKKRPLHTKDEGKYQRMEEDGITCLEDRLRAVGIICEKDGNSLEGYARSHSKSSLDATLFSSFHQLIDVNIPRKKIRAHVLSMSPFDAYKMLEVLASAWKTRPASSKEILPWIYCILVNHSRFILAQETSSELLDVLQKMASSKRAAMKSLLKLSGSVQLIMTQMQKAGGANMVQQSNIENKAPQSEVEDDYDDGDDEEDVDELVYGEEKDESQSDSDDNEESQP